MASLLAFDVDVDIAVCRLQPEKQVTAAAHRYPYMEIYARCQRRQRQSHSAGQKYCTEYIKPAASVFFGGVRDGVCVVVFVSVRACCKTCKIFNDCMHAIFHIFSIRRVAQLRLRLRLLRCVATTKNNKAIKHLFEIC